MQFKPAALLCSAHFDCIGSCSHSSVLVGIVHWNPPQQAMDAVVASAGDHSLNQYGSGAGLPKLVQALKQKLSTHDGLDKVCIQKLCFLLCCFAPHKLSLEPSVPTILDAATASSCHSPSCPALLSSHVCLPSGFLACQTVTQGP